MPASPRSDAADGRPARLLAWRPRSLAAEAGLVAGLFAVVLCVVFAPVVFGGKAFAPNGVVPTQSGRPAVDFPYATQSGSVVNDQGAFVHQFEPWARLVHEQYAAGVVPLWNPRAGLGEPLAANLQSAVAGPFYAPLAVRPTQAVWNFVILLRLLVGAVGCFVLLRVLGAVVPAALVASTGYLVAPAFVVWAGSVSLSVEALVPWLLVAVRALLREPSTAAFVGLALGTAAAILGGQPEVLVVLTYLAAAWTAYWAVRDRVGWRRVADVVVAAAAGGLVVAPQLLLGAEYLSNSFDAHGGGLAETQFPADRLRTIVLGDFQHKYYASLAICTFVLAVAGIVARRAAGVAATGFFLVAIALYLVRAFDVPGSGVIDLLPGVSRINVPRYGFFVLTLGGAVLAAAGVQALIAGSRRAAVAATIAALAPILLWPGGGLVKRAVVFGLLMAGLAWAIRARPGLAAAAAVLLLLQVFALTPRTFAQRYDPFAPRPFARFLQENVRPGERVAATGDVLHPLYSAALGLSDPRSVDALHPDRYARYVQSALRACMCGSFAAKLQLRHGDSPFLDALGVRYLVTPASARPPGHYELAWRDPAGVVAVWRNARAYPRAWIPTVIVPASGRDEAERLLTDGSGRLDQASVVEHPTAEMRAVPGSGSAALEREGWNESTYVVRARGPVTVVVSEAYYPGWKAEVDGQATPIRPANLAMRAVSVPSGTHTLTFRYRPALFRWGGLLSLAGLVLLVAWPLATARRRRNEIVTTV